jgi:ribosomal protein S1
MKPDTLDRFRKREFKPGDSMLFYIGEVTKDNRIILTEESPEEKKQKIQTFVEANKGKTLEANIAAVMNFGILIDLNGLTGLIPMIEFRKNKVSLRNYIVGDKINVIFDQINNEKINFKLAFKNENL